MAVAGSRTSRRVADDLRLTQGPSLTDMERVAGRDGAPRPASRRLPCELGDAAAGLARPEPPQGQLLAEHRLGALVPPSIGAAGQLYTPMFTVATDWQSPVELHVSVPDRPG